MRSLRRFHPTTHSILAALLAVVLTLTAWGVSAISGHPAASPASLSADLASVALASLPAQSVATAPHVAPPRASRVERPAPAVVVGDLSALLDRLAMCESGMNRYTRGPFHSYFQWMLKTWHAVSGLPGAPEDYDYATQKAMAARIPVSAWHRQFPACSRRLGV